MSEHVTLVLFSISKMPIWPYEIPGSQFLKLAKENEKQRVKIAPKCTTYSYRYASGMSCGNIEFGDFFAFFLSPEAYVLRQDLVLGTKTSRSLHTDVPVCSYKSAHTLV